MKASPIKVSAAALLLAAALAATRPGTAPAQARPAAPSLCRAPEAVLFTCRVGARTVSICGRAKEQGGAVYRYGRLGRLEIEAADLHRAFEGWPGGGETQAYADTPTHRYVVFDRMVRTGIDNEGHNIPRMTQGLLVQSGGRTLSRQDCAQPVGFLPPGFDQRLLETLVPEGEYVDH